MRKTVKLLLVLSMFVFSLHKYLVKCISFHSPLIQISKATASYLQYLNPKGEELYKHFASVPILFTLYCSCNICCADGIEIKYV